MMQEMLSQILTYKSLHALCAVMKKKGEDGKPQMRVVYYVSCLVYGPNPVWGVWNVNRRFLHFAGGREAIGKQHPRLAWRRIMTRWHLADDKDMPAEARRQALALEFESPLPKPAKKPKPEIGAAVAPVTLH